MTKPTVLYHYTSVAHLEEIIVSGSITKAPSNLLRPRNLKVVGTALVDEATDWFKPVVWMTDSLSPEGLGLPDIKKRIRISIPMQRHFKKWNKWAKRNNMAPHLIRGPTISMSWQSWYISEYEISLLNGRPSALADTYVANCPGTHLCLWTSL